MSEETRVHAPEGAATQDDAELRQRVRVEQIDITYDRSLVPIGVAAAFAALMAFVLAPAAGTAAAAAWFALRMVVAAWRLLQRAAYLASADRAAPIWRTSLLLALAVDGFVWGLAGVWLTPLANREAAILTLIALMGVAAVGSFLLQNLSRAALAFCLPLLLPAAVMHLAQGDRQGALLGIGTLTFLVMMLSSVRGAERGIVELLRLRFFSARIAAEREQALRLAERQSGVKSQFLAMMSHEMRTPLHAMLGLTRQLRENAPADAAPRLALIERSGEHLLTLISDVLEFSRLEAGRVKLKLAPFDLAALIGEVSALAAVSAQESGLVLKTRLALPQPCPVFGDAARLRQILQNLLGNAIKFTEQGSVTIVATHDDDTGLTRIEVIDTGIGIGPEQLPRIFDAFAQADETSMRRYGGTGLGLTISRELARAMGGDLACCSTPGHGSAFTLTLELAPISAEELPAPAQPPRALPRFVGRVLLAEDNPINVMVAEAALRKFGLEVEVVHDGAAAVEAFRRLRPDVVLMNCQMPVMDGFEAARRIRASEIEGDAAVPRTPMVALTADALDEDRERTLASGMDDHLAKPFREDQLARMLRRHLRRAA